MEIQKIKSIIESILFSAGRIVSEEELVLALELDKEQIEKIIRNMQEEYKVGDKLLVKVKEIDLKKHKISLQRKYDYEYEVE